MFIPLMKEHQAVRKWNIKPIFQVITPETPDNVAKNFDPVEEIEDKKKKVSPNMRRLYKKKWEYLRGFKEQNVWSNLQSLEKN